MGKEKRGFTTQEENLLFADKSRAELILFLNSQNPKDRTSAATILGQRKSESSISALCKQLHTEKALYSRIALCEALGDIGTPALKILINFIGQIGNNQHKALPKKPFLKWNYPLARDIVARTICKIGVDALPDLGTVLVNGNRIQIRESIDCIGYISFYSRNDTSFQVLTRALKKYGSDEIIQWKIIRALSAFANKNSETILVDVLKASNKPELKWEAIRSLGLISREAPERLLMAKSDGNENVRKMASISIEKIAER